MATSAMPRKPTAWLKTAWLQRPNDCSRTQVFMFVQRELSIWEQPVFFAIFGCVKLKTCQRLLWTNLMLLMQPSLTESGAVGTT